jgi:hypothetical protein
VRAAVLDRIESAVDAPDEDLLAERRRGLRLVALELVGEQRRVPVVAEAELGFEVGSCDWMAERSFSEWPSLSTGTAAPRIDCDSVRPSRPRPIRRRLTRVRKSVDSPLVRDLLRASGVLDVTTGPR